MARCTAYEFQVHTEGGTDAAPFRESSAGGTYVLTVASGEAKLWDQRRPDARESAFE